MRKETSGVDILLGLDGGELRVSSSILYLREGKDWWKTTRSMPTPIIERLRPMVGEYLKGGEGRWGTLAGAAAGATVREKQTTAGDVTSLLLLLRNVGE